MSFIRELAESLGGVSQFEMTPVIVKTIHVPSTESDSLDLDAILVCNESDFDSDISLSTYASLLQQVNLQRSERASKQKKNALCLTKFDECDNFQRHIREKGLVRNSKNQAKETAKIKDQETVICFDLQEVLQTPYTFESSTYYYRKLSTYNLSVYESQSKKAYCYVWIEGQELVGQIRLLHVFSSI